MDILVFSSKWLETASTLAIRTGLSINKGEWKPVPCRGYIIYGAETQTDLLLQIQEQMNCSYVIINDVDYDVFKGTNYHKLLKNSIVLEQEIGDVDYYSAEGIPTEFIQHEYFMNENKEWRPIDYLYLEGGGEEAKGMFLDPAIKSTALSDKLNYTIEQLTTYFKNSKCYISHKKRDWLNINKAIACGCKVISCMESAGMMELYKPFVTFQGEINIDCVLLEPDFQQFQNSITHFSLNKYLPIIKNIYELAENKVEPKPIGKTESDGTGVIAG